MTAAGSPTDLPAARLSARTLAVAATGTLLALVCFTTPVASLADTARGLRAGPEAQAWILSSMSLGLAVALLTAGAVADDFGRRRVFVVGSGLLAVASVPCALAPDPLVLVLGRVFQGVGAAAVIACSLALISHQFPPGAGRARASGIWGAALGAGIAAGPLVAAGLGLVFGWRAAYWAIGLAAAALAVAAASLLPESRAAHRRPVDVAGVALLSTGLGVGLAGLTLARSGITQPAVLALVAGAVVLLIGFGVVEMRSHAPMFDPALLRNRAFVVVNVAALATGLGVIAQMSFFSTVVQRALHRSELSAALALLGWSAVSVLTALLARHLRLSGRLQLAFGLLVVAVGQAAMGWLSPTSSAWQAVPGLVVAGMGSGVINAGLGREAVASVPAARAAMGSGANNTSRYVGSAIGVTVVAIVATSARPGTPEMALTSGWNAAVVVTTAASLVGAAVLFAMRPRVGAAP